MGESAHETWVGRGDWAAARVVLEYVGTYIEGVEGIGGPDDGLALRFSAPPQATTRGGNLVELEAIGFNDEGIEVLARFDDQDARWLPIGHLHGIVRPL